MLDETFDELVPYDGKATVGRQDDGHARSSSYVNMWTFSFTISTFTIRSWSLNVQKKKEKKKRKKENATAITGQLI